MAISFLSASLTAGRKENGQSQIPNPDTQRRYLAYAAPELSSLRTPKEKASADHIPVAESWGFLVH